MKHIDLGDAPAQLNGSLLTYQQGNYRYRVKIPTGSPQVYVGEAAGAGRSTITFCSWKGAVVMISGRTAIIESIFRLVGGRGER